MKRSIKIVTWVAAGFVILIGAGLVWHQLGSGSTNHVTQSKSSRNVNRTKQSPSVKSSSAESKSSSASHLASVADVVKAAPQTLNQLKANAGGTYSAISATADGDNMVSYVMTLAQPLDKNTDQGALKIALVKALMPAISAAKKARPGIQLKVILRNPDDSEVINQPIAKHEIDQDVQ
ncbi:hypothetical protein ACFQ3L_09660 [Lacticaseibacillus jixianensis]|uniref:Lipoprotein n=1 Tax=Lacticaseibacillus jixianensis TaxID=2486012 RepID=A0ABW4BA82_9LACO|nr:hypothetical protein [Lacticaseibacillus jixianensis]